MINGYPPKAERHQDKKGMCMSESGLPKHEGRLIERIRFLRALGSG